MTLDEADIEAIARRVAELVAEPRVDRKLTTAQVAEEYGVSPDWVRDHAGELRAIRIGNDRNGELRFDRRDVQRAMDQRRIQPPAAPRQRQRPGRKRGSASYDMSTW